MCVCVCECVEKAELERQFETEGVRRNVSGSLFK